MNKRTESEIRNAARVFVATITSALIESTAHKVPGLTQRRGRPPSKPYVDERTLLREIRREGGRRSELIAKSLGVSSKMLALPLRHLIDEKKIRAKGKARGTAYTAS